MTGARKNRATVEPATTHIRVSRLAAQRLRLIIVRSGGHFHGRLTEEASIALNERAEKLERELKDKVRTTNTRS